MQDVLTQMQCRLHDFVVHFSAAFNVEIEIFDEQCCVTATDPARTDTRIGKPLPPCGVRAQRLCASQVEAPPFSEAVPGAFCSDCTCPRHNESLCLKNGMYAILAYRHHVFGLVSVFSVDEEAGKLPLRPESFLRAILKELADMVMFFIWEDQTRRKLTHASNLVYAVLNLCDKSVLLIDQRQRIIDVNSRLLEQLQTSKAELLGQDFTVLFPAHASGQRKNKNGCQDLWYEAGNRRLHLRGTMTPLLAQEENGWALCSLEDGRNTERVHRLATLRRKKIRLSDIVSEDEAFNAFKAKVATIATNDSTVLLIGETGTGKELFARALHEESPRHNDPFVAINCSSIPDNLFESELFGYEKGAFTGANASGKSGRFLLADKGTLFLDELEALPPLFQPKLLRAVEQGEIERVGGGLPIAVDVRIIAATNQCLEALVERGTFREDLYYRLNVVGLRIPPLRERGNDVLVLARLFLKIFSEKCSKNIQGFSLEAEHVLCRYPWPGNVRELQNAIEHAVNMEPSTLIALENLPFRLGKWAEGGTALRVGERERLCTALNHYGWTEEGKVQAAHALGISRSTIYRKIQAYGLKVPGHIPF